MWFRRAEVSFVLFEDEEELIEKRGQVQAGQKKIQTGCLINRLRKWMAKSPYSQLLDDSEQHSQWLSDEKLPISTRQLMDSALLESVDAQFMLGFFFETGKGGLPLQPEEAFYWYQSASRNGHQLASNTLGVLLAKGLDGSWEPSINEAIPYFRLAAKQGSVAARFNLGLAHAKGNGVKPNDSKAFSHFKEAAKRGHALAQASVGAMYLGGRGVQFDNMKAKKWLNMASINTEDYDSGKDPALSEVSSIELQYVKDRVSCVNFLNMNLHLEMSSGSPFIVSFEYCPFVLDAIPQNICPAE